MLIMYTKQRTKRVQQVIQKVESAEYRISMPSVIWHYSLGSRKGILPVKLSVGMLLVMIWLEIDANDLCIFWRFPLSPLPFTNDTSSAKSFLATAKYRMLRDICQCWPVDVFWSYHVTVSACMAAGLLLWGWPNGLELSPGQSPGSRCYYRQL